MNAPPRTGTTPPGAPPTRPAPAQTHELTETQGALLLDLLALRTAHGDAEGGERDAAQTLHDLGLAEIRHDRGSWTLRPAAAAPWLLATVVHGQRGTVFLAYAYAARRGLNAHLDALRLRHRPSERPFRVQGGGTYYRWSHPDADRHTWAACEPADTIPAAAGGAA